MRFLRETDTQTDTNGFLRKSANPQSLATTGGRGMVKPFLMRVRFPLSAHNISDLALKSTHTNTHIR